MVKAELVARLKYLQRPRLPSAKKTFEVVEVPKDLVQSKSELVSESLRGVIALDLAKSEALGGEWPRPDSRQKPQARMLGPVCVGSIHGARRFRCHRDPFSDTGITFKLRGQPASP